MREKLRTHVTYANVVATLALFLALGGTSVAAIQLGKNSVKAKQIAPSAVGTSEVKDRSLKSKDFGKGVLLRGPQGPAGADSLTNLVVREYSENVNVNCVGAPPILTCTPEKSFVTAPCQAGERALYASGGPTAAGTVPSGGPTPQPVGGAPTAFKVPVSVTAISPTPITSTPVNVTLICASP
jgi:hypothetical protein